MRNITIRARIILLICIAVAFAALVGGSFTYELLQVRSYALGQTQDVMLAGEKDKLRLSVHALATSMAEVARGMPPDKSLQAKELAGLVADLRFEEDKSGYFFIYEGTTVVTVPIKPELTGKDLSGVKDKNGFPYVVELAKAAQGGGGFVSYVYDKPGKGLQPKLSYSEKIPAPRSGSAPGFTWTTSRTRSPTSSRPSPAWCARRPSSSRASWPRCWFWACCPCPWPSSAA